jgi:hypothetical protein
MTLYQNIYNIGSVKGKDLVSRETSSKGMKKEL